MSEQEKNEEVIFNYFDSINKKVVPLKVDKEIVRVFRRSNKKEQREKSNMKKYGVCSLEQLDESGIEIADEKFEDDFFENIEHEKDKQEIRKLALYIALRMITEKQKNVVIARFYERKSYEQIAREQNTNISTIRGNLRNALYKMKIIIEKLEKYKNLEEK